MAQNRAECLAFVDTAMNKSRGLFWYRSCVAVVLIRPFVRTYWKPQITHGYVIAGFRRVVNQIFAVLGCYTARVFKSEALLLDSSRWDRYVAPETSVSNDQFTLCNIPEERRSHTRLYFVHSAE